MSEPVKDGAERMAPYSMPGTTTSMPKTAVPVHFATVSRRASGLPISVNSARSLSGGDAASGSLAAAAASAPYDSLWPCGPTTKPLSARHWSAVTFQ